MATDKNTNVNTTAPEANASVPVDIAALKEQIRAEVKAEIVTELEKEKETASVPLTKKEIDYWNELVDYDAPWIEGAEEEITVGHNGKFYKIRRGESVKIPRKVKDILINAEKQKRDFSKVKKGLRNQEIQA